MRDERRTEPIGNLTRSLTQSLTPSLVILIQLLRGVRGAGGGEGVQGLDFGFLGVCTTLHPTLLSLVFCDCCPGSDDESGSGSDFYFDLALKAQRAKCLRCLDRPKLGYARTGQATLRTAID